MELEREQHSRSSRRNMVPKMEPEPTFLRATVTNSTRYRPWWEPGVTMAFMLRIFGGLLGATVPLWAQAGEPSDAALSVQVALDRANFSPGVIDATMGRLTRQAIKGFQEANNLPVTGN